MCGIIGYVGNGEAAEFLMQGLTCLEYRGYDSAGIAGFDGRDLRIEKAVGRLDCLKEKLQGNTPAGHIGIGHTRWATHGIPSEVNAHPHICDNLALVHNGIIEN